MCSRQSGKTTFACLKAVHVALYTPGSLVLIVCPSERQSGEAHKKCQALMRDLGWPVPVKSQTALTTTLENGGRIVALPGSESTVRGYSSVDLLGRPRA